MLVTEALVEEEEQVLGGWQMTSSRWLSKLGTGTELDPMPPLFPLSCVTGQMSLQVDLAKSLTLWDWT